MPDDPTKRAPQDAGRVSLEQPHEVRYWTDKWDVSRPQLEAAIGRVGNSVAALDRELGDRTRYPASGK